MIDVSPLFTPFDLGGLALANRIVMAPMTRSRSPGFTPRPDAAAYYRRRAAGGVGLIISEGTTVDHPSASPQATIPAFHGAALEGWKRSWTRCTRRVAESCRSSGTSAWRATPARRRCPNSRAWAPLAFTNLAIGLRIR